MDKTKKMADKEFDYRENDTPQKGHHGLLKNPTCKELLVGLGACLVLGIVIIGVFVPGHLKWECVLGYLIGVAVAILMVLHMTYALEQAVCMNEHGAEIHVRKTTAIRMLVVYAIFITIGIMGFCNILAALAGIMTLKVAAYLQPITHKVLANKNSGKGG